MSAEPWIWPAFTSPGPLRPQRNPLGAFGMHAQRDLLDVQHDVGDVFAHALDG